MHPKENSRTSNTGRLAHLSLPNSEIRMRVMESTADLAHSPDYRTALLYPTADAETLDEAWVTRNAPSLQARPLRLIVPDGNWRQASKVSVREKDLANLPRLSLPPGPPSRYRLRHSPHPHHLSTIEAIARALGTLHGPAVRESLEALLDLHVARTFASRGRQSDGATGLNP